MDKPKEHAHPSLQLAGYTVIVRGDAEPLTFKQEMEIMDVALLANDYERLRAFID